MKQGISDALAPARRFRYLVRHQIRLPKSPLFGVEITQFPYRNNSSFGTSTAGFDLQYFHIDQFPEISQDSCRSPPPPEGTLR